GRGRPPSSPCTSIRRGRRPTGGSRPTCTGSSRPTSRSPRRPSSSRASAATRSSSSTSCTTQPTSVRGAPIQTTFADASRRLALSGTPFRSDTRAIPFVRYDGDEAVPDYEYSYGDALADRRVVRPVYFPRTNGHMEWSAPDGSLHSATFDDALSAARAGERLRTALSLEGDWLPTVLGAAVERLGMIRREQPDAGGLVIATDQEHARGIAEMLRDRFHTRARVVTSDDPAASAGIHAYAAGREPWLVAVRMVSEGVDIPRLRVGVYATTTATELFFRQAVGRLVRWTRGTAR